MIRTVVYSLEFSDYLMELKGKGKPYYDQHVEIIVRACKALSVEAERKYQAEEVEGCPGHFRMYIQAELLDNVYPPDGYRLHFSIEDDMVVVASITFTDIDTLRN